MCLLPTSLPALPAFSVLRLTFVHFFPPNFSVFLGKIKDAFDRNPQLQNLLLDDFFKSAVENCQVGSPRLGGGNRLSRFCVSLNGRRCTWNSVALTGSGYLLCLWLVFAQDSWRRAVSTGVQAGVPMPCFTTALSFYDGYRHEMLPANLIQVSSRSRCQTSTWLVPRAACPHITPTNPISCFPGSAGLLWGSHLRTLSQTWTVYPHQLDRPRWQRVVLFIQCLTRLVTRHDSLDWDIPLATAYTALCPTFCSDLLKWSLIRDS